MVKTIKDYYEQIYELFPTIPKKDIQRILNYCWKCVYLHNSYGADVLITSSKFWCFFGILRNNTARHCFVYKIKLVTKLRILYKKKHIKYDGYFAKGKYEGDLVNGMKEGKGTYTWPNGNKYVGEWKNNAINGKGEFSFVSGDKYNGNWTNNNFEGEGEFSWSNGDKYQGNWKNGKKHGHGIFYYSDGDVYDGEWFNDMKEGKGIVYYENGDREIGDFLNDCIKGLSVKISSDGKIFTCNV